MKNQKTFTAILTGAFFAIAAIVMPMSANAQLRYQNQYSKAQVGQTISRLESSSTTFRYEFDRAMDNSNLNGTSTEDRYNRDVKNYADSLTRLRREFNRNNSWWQVRNDVQGVIGQATTVNTWMNNLNFRRNIERQWNQMRNDVNTLADTFDLQGLEGGGWNGGNNGGGWNGGNNGGGWNGNGQTSNPPNWARGTFYGTAPDGSQITLTLSNNGQVTAMINGSPSYGTYYRNSININGARARVTQQGNGLRTTRNDNGEVINYYRDGFGNNNGGGWNGGNIGNRPSNWAIGSFTAQNPQNGGTIYLTVSNDGQVTVNMDGNMSYGTLSGNTLNINGATATVSRNGNGIRTTRNDNGERINYRRQ